MKLHTKIIMGLLLGTIAGLALQLLQVDPLLIKNVVSFIKPVGDIFLRLIFMMVIPLIICALILGVYELGDLTNLGRIGWKAMAYTIVVSGISVFVGVICVNVFKPGSGITPEIRNELLENYKADINKVTANVEAVKTKTIGEIITSLVPKNPIEDAARAFDPTYSGGGILAIMVFALIFGIAMISSHSPKTNLIKDFIEALYEIIMRIISMAMKVAPFGVFALMFSLTATLGFSIIVVLLKFVLVVLLALAIQQFGVYSLLLHFFAKMNPIQFFKNISEVMLTAFSTSSSNASLPTALRVAIDKVKLPKDITHFILTVGSTANQNGTALYEGVTVLFLAQVFGVDLSIGQQVYVVLMCILAGVGTAGVPGGSLPVIAIILMSVGVPGAAIGLIIGVDRILDMCRTVLNVSGDITMAAVISRWEKKL